VGLQLGHQADAAPFLILIDHESAAFLGDRLHGELKLAAAIATQRAEHFAGEALRVNTQERCPLAQVAEHENERGFGGSNAGPYVALVSHRFEHAPLGGQAGRRDPPQHAHWRRCSGPVFVRGHRRRPYLHRYGPMRPRRAFSSWRNWAGVSRGTPTAPPWLLPTAPPPSPPPL